MNEAVRVEATAAAPPAAPAGVAPAAPEPKAEPTRSRRTKPAVPAWEDVLLGVRSSGQR